MLELHLIRTWVRSHMDTLREERLENSDRGDIVQQVIYIAVLAAATILITGILVGKAKSAATNVKIQ